MHTQSECPSAYAQSHRNAVNQAIHVVCVPVIAFSTLGLLWAIPLGRWLGMAAPCDQWVNVVTLSLLPLATFYWWLSFASFVTMLLWCLLSIEGSVRLQQRFGNAGLAIVCAVLWISAWLVQFYGHKLEGAKPSFLEDLVFLLIGPLFVMDKVLQRAGLKGL
jgi:uncharacterized membrane protein YGL010W